MRACARVRPCEVRLCTKPLFLRRPALSSLLHVAFSRAAFLAPPTSSRTSLPACSYVKSLLGGYLLWPAAGLLNFALLPNEYRLLFNNCVNIIWTCFLSIVSATPPARMLGREGGSSRSLCTDAW